MCDKDVARASMVVKRREEGMLEAMEGYQPSLEACNTLPATLVRNIMNSLDVVKVAHGSQV